MKKAVLSCLVFVVFLCLVSVAYALEYSADMVSTAHGRSTTTKVFAKDKMFRMESKSAPTYTIVRGDKQVTWLVMPDQKSYMEMKADQSQQPKAEEKVRGEVSRKLIGAETVDGHPAQKYEVTYTDAGKTEKMYQWMATDIKFPVKMAAVDGSWTLEYKNIKMGPQAASLFEVPSDYKKMAMPSMPGMPKMPKIPGRGGSE